MANAYRAADQRGGLSCGYIVSGAHVIGPSAAERGCRLPIISIEFEIFGAGGFVGSRTLDDFPPLACRHHRDSTYMDFKC
jgi:hypothetical protein